MSSVLTNYTIQPNGCWWWNGTVDHDGYGRLKYQGKMWGAHRLVSVLTDGPIPAGLTVDHVCHNADGDCVPATCMHRRCVNPAHLERVPRAVNMARGKASRKRCSRGHEMTPSNTYVKPSREGRECRACRALMRPNKRSAA